MGKDFCLGNGYKEDTFSYEACTNRYRERLDSFLYCTETRGLKREDESLADCLNHIAPKVELKFTKHRASCETVAEQQMLTYYNYMLNPALELTNLFMINNAQTKEEKQKLEDEEQKRKQKIQDERDKKNQDLINRCMNEKGWINGDAWWKNKMAPDVDTNIKHNYVDEDLKEGNIDYSKK